MQKTNLSFLTLLFMAGLVFYACKKTDTKDSGLLQRSEPALSLAEAKSFFNRTVKEISPESISASAPSKFFNIPIWDSAVYEMGANGVNYWRIPLESKEKIVRRLTIFNKDKKQDQVLMPPPSLLIYQDSTHRMQILVTQSIPNPSKRTGKGPSFTGEVKMYDWNGNFDHGFVYQDGKKQKQITSTKNMRYKAGNPNAKWEYRCIEYTDCEFQAECVGSTSTGTLIIVAFAVVRTDNGGCYSPSDDPYASTPLGYDWNCGGWRHTNTQPAVECAEVWIEDDPDPDPDPYWDGMEEGYPYGWWEDDTWLTQNFAIFREEPQLTASEKLLIKEYPGEALLIRANARAAEDEVIRLFGMNRVNDKSDAFRHALWLALNAKALGEVQARKWGEAHESEVPANKTLEKQMDLFNNEVGIGLAEVNYVNVLSDKVWSAMQNGELRYLSPLDFMNPTYVNGIIPGITQLIPTNQ